MSFKFLAILVSSVWICYGDDRYRCPKRLEVNNYLKTHGDHCFEFVNKERTWFGANSDCRSRRGHLVVIPDEATQNFLMSALRELHWPRNGIWIGASDRQHEMNWKWVTNKLVKRGYSNWASGQPSCHIFCFEDCALLRLDDGGKWHDYKCSWIEDYSYICQYPMLPKTTSTTTTTTVSTTTTTTSTSVTTSAVTSTSLTKSMTTILTLQELNSTQNETSLIVNLQPDVQVFWNEGNAVRRQMKQAEQESGLDTGSVVGLIFGLVCGICLGLCLGILVIRHRNKRQKEELPTVVFANPYYADVRTPLGNRASDEAGLGDCCFGGASASESSTPVKQPLCVDLQRSENVYDSDPTMATEYLIPKPWVGAGQYDEINPQVLAFLPDERIEVEGAYGGEAEMLWDNHYDYTTGENFYESVDNVRQAIEQNTQNKHKEDMERYVPFQCDDP